MHTDRKIGFAMGILLIGIVAALFFRNEPLLNPDLPTVRRANELNERLRERDVAVYLNDADSPKTSDSTSAARPRSLRDALDSMGGRKNPRVSETTGSQSIVETGSEDAAAAHSSDDEIVPIPTIEQFTKKEPPSEVTPIESATSLDAPAPIVSIPSDTAPAITEPHEGVFQPPAEFDEYVVKYGDTLSGIAQRLLGSQSRYQEIFEANRDRMSSPDRLDVGKPLRIPRVATRSDNETH